MTPFYLFGSRNSWQAKLNPKVALLVVKLVPYSMEHGILELIPVLNSRPAADQSHKSGGKLPLPSTMAAVTFLAAEHHRPLTSAKLYCLMHKGLNNLYRVVTQPRTDGEFNPRILGCKPDAPRVVSPRLTYCSPYCRMFSVVCSCSWQCN